MIIVKEYVDYLKVVKNRAESTILVYETELNAFFKWYRPRDNFNNIESSIKNINKKVIDDYLRYLESIGNSPRTRARKISTLKEFFKWAKIEGYVNDNPMDEIEMPKCGQPLPKYLTLDECMRLLEVTNQGLNKERNYCIVVFFLNCGLRLSELCGIKLSDIKDDYSVRILGKGNKERIIYLNRSCIRSLNKYLEVRPQVDCDYLFLSNRKTPLSKKGVQSMISSKLEAAELYGYSVHKLRHTCATLMYNYGGTDILTIKEVLGHANVSTTQIYTHMGDDKVKEAIDKNPLNGIG